MQGLITTHREILRKALTLALVSAFVIQPFIPLIAFADDSQTTVSVGQVATITTTGQSSWTVPAGVSAIKVGVWGAGGSAGTGEKITDAHRSGLGGGAGGYTEKTLSVTAGETFSISVGAGGQGIKSVMEGRIGNEGQESRFEGSFGVLRATGGQGGASFTGHGNPTNNFGAGGIGEGGDVNQNGGNGEPYTEYDSNPYASNGGSAYNGGQGGSRGRCGREGTCPGSEPGSPLAQDGGFPGGGGGGSDVATGGFGGNGQVSIEIVSVTGTGGGSNNTLPIGYIDSATCSAIVGWTYDADNSAVSIGVHFYTDNDVFIGNTEANLPRADVNQTMGVSGDHGYSFPIPDSLRDGQTHAIYAYGINSNGSTNTLLSNSPASITGCTPTGVTGLTPNRAPSAPTVQALSASGSINTTHTFSAVASDPEGDSIEYLFDWDNDGVNDDISGIVPNSTSVQMGHAWNSAGTYPVRVQARDTKGAYSPVTTVNFVVSNASGGGTVNTAPNLPSLLAPVATGTLGTDIQFSVVATDPQNDTISYGFDWENNGTYEFSAPTLSGISAQVTHRWNTAGTYTFSVVARDAAGLRSQAITHIIVISNTVTGGGSTSVPNITSFFVNPSSIQTGNTATLNWTSVHATACIASGDWTGNQAFNGPIQLGVQNVSITTTKTYTLSCGNGVSTSTQTAYLTITVPTSTGGGSSIIGPAITSFTSSVPTNIITSGTSFTLSWSSINANTCEASGAWLGYKNTSGSETITPASVSTATDLTYVLSCGGTSTTTQSVTIRVNPISGGGPGGGSVVVSPTIDFSVSPVSGLVTTESGVTASFAVALLSQPSVNVILPILSSNFAEGTTSVRSLTFTPANWNLPQNVTVTGVDDTAVDGNVSYMVSVGPSISTDASWNALTVKTVSVTNNDNDTSGTSGGGSTGGSSSSSSSSGGSRRGGGGSGGPCVGNGCPSTTAPNIIITFDTPRVNSASFGPELVCSTTNFITSFMRKGIDNNPNEVRKLQYFLNVYEGANLTINGDFDTQTEAAVTALQSKHSDEILTPWGTSTPTGIVYITTARYINRVFCADNPTYSGNEDIKDIIDTSVLYTPTDNSAEFDGVVGSATSTISTNIAGVFGAMSSRISDLIKDIPWYQLLVLALIIVGTGFMIASVFRKDIGTHEYFMSFIKGTAALAIGTVLNVLNAVSFILNPQWFTDHVGFGLGWLLALDIVNFVAFIAICLAILFALYTRIAKRPTTY